jgi:AmiR/NasT family two-component response regulator
VDKPEHRPEHRAENRPEHRSVARDLFPASAEEFEQVLAARSVIDQAKGILMERYTLDADAAFAVLVRHSQHANRKLRSIAEELVSSRRLPSDPTGRRSSQER